MRSPLSWLCRALPALLAAGSLGVRAMNYAVPYVREGLEYSLDTWGYGATLGLLEVNNGDNAILTYSNAPEWGLQTFRDVQDFSGYAPITNDSAHGTLVAHILDNMYSFNDQTNIPYGALNLQTDYITTWSLGMAPRASYYGALFDGNDTKSAFLSLNSSLAYLTGTAHVQAINNSWGGAVNQASDLNGLGDYALLMDEYTGYHGKTNGTTGAYRDVLMVIAAGNSGALLGTPADAYNGLTVGALDNGNHTSTYLDDPTRAPIPVVADYSSKWPLANGRCGVDVVAPGTWMAIVENFTVGTDNGSLVLKNLTGVLGSGTSFATPLITGLAGILYGAPDHPLDNTENLISVSTATLKGTPFSTDHKLIKALIINSADKIAGCDSNGVAQATWQPGEISVGLDGVTNSIHPLNYAVGSGQANANEAYFSYYEVSNRFWDVNMLNANGQTNFYTYGQDKFVNADLSSPALRLTATLVWDRHVDYTVNIDTNDLNNLGTLLDTNLLSNLDLVLQEESAPGVWADLYRSISTVDNVEQIYMDELSATNSYRLDVIATSLVDPVGGEQYALVVSYLPIPEPATAALTGLCALGALARRRWLRRRGSLPSGASQPPARQRMFSHASDAGPVPVRTGSVRRRSAPTAAASHDIYAATPPRLAAAGAQFAQRTRRRG
jgi:hypothetical protein